ncbi:MAG: uridine kinase [Saprospiraceae bacterium]|jgi:uridine kinase|nr:uridine kinase [Saprospiraceae bacterium]MBK9581018.1 uridine kinase [Saprospiraceae bacterium]MBK9742130.1 uridine kinase [Saprospiraceae bacterium]MBP6539630.1 uridine kinase [Saprospiraceae bacterium]MBP8213422.1 uridine kinase [Saprospiraceae bacterium]
MSLKNSNSFIIGISGGSGSGKTSFIRDIKEHFSKEQICFLSQDDYYKPRELQKEDENGIKNFDLPESIEMDEFYFDLVKLTNGMSVERPEYTFNNENKNPGMIHLDPAPIIIVEGLFVFYEPKLFNLLDLKILIHASDTQKIIRRIKRDRVERNYPLEDVLYRYEHHVLPSFETYIFPFFNKVDIVINNNKSFDMGKEMLNAFLRNRLHM